MFIAVAVLLVLGVAEVSSWAFFSLFHDRFTFFDPGAYSPGAEHIRRLVRRFDRELGWDMAFPTQFGERPHPVSYGRRLIGTFGDSFTYCDGVSDSQTWQVYLSEHLKADVYNFGVQAFGTDQAYLKFLRTYPKVRTPIVILGLIAENINRILNVYRPFYSPSTKILLSKPCFVLTEDGLRLRENPLRRSEDIPRLGDPVFLRELGRNDYWFNRQGYPMREFPYSRLLLSRRIWFDAVHHKDLYGDMNPRPGENLWVMDEPTAIMCALVDSFFTRARAFRAIPVLMLLPQRFELRTRRATGRPIEAQAFLTGFCSTRRYAYFDAIEALARRASTPAEGDAFFSGHLSALGNQVLANEILLFLARLLECETWEVGKLAVASNPQPRVQSNLRGSDSLATDPRRRLASPK